MPPTSFLPGRLLDALARPARPARAEAPRPPARAPDRLSDLLSRHVRLQVALRVTPTGGIEASVPDLPDCSVQGDTCEAALGRLRAAVVARLFARDDARDGDRLARARPADAAPEAGCAWTEIVVVVDGEAAGPLAGRGA